MLEREFGPKSKRKEGSLEDADGKPFVGSVDRHGRLITQGPKKRIAARVAQMFLALAAAIPSIYAALVCLVPSPIRNTLTYLGRQ
jgi:hypothetical protein